VGSFSKRLTSLNTVGDGALFRCGMGSFGERLIGFQGRRRSRRLPGFQGSSGGGGDGGAGLAKSLRDQGMGDGMLEVLADLVAKSTNFDLVISLLDVAGASYSCGPAVLGSGGMAVGPPSYSLPARA